MTIGQDIQGYYDYALMLVKSAGKIVLEAKDVVIERKEEVWDLVTEYDRKVEEILIKKLKEKYPTHKFIGEEESHDKGFVADLTNEPTWIIDPIDGTANFVRKLPITCISVGLTVNKEQVVGIVYNPFSDELFTAIKGHGAFRNGKRISPKKTTKIEETNFNYELSLARSESLRDLYMYRLSGLIGIVEGIRALGSAAMGLCYVAAGFTDVYQCDGLSPWDAAAGVLIVREAGGYVCDSSEARLGQEFDIMNPNFLAAPNKEISDQYVEIERKADLERLNKKK